MGKFPRKIEGYECQGCGEFYEHEDEARDCCPSVEEVTRWQCVTCEEYHEEKEDAYHCCD